MNIEQTTDITKVITDDGTAESLVERLRYYQENEHVHPAIAFARLLQQRGSEEIFSVFTNFISFWGPKRTIQAAYKKVEGTEFEGQFRVGHALLTLGIAWEGMLQALLQRENIIDMRQVALLYNRLVSGIGLPRRPDVVGVESLPFSLDEDLGRFEHDLTGSFLFGTDTMPRAITEFFYQTRTGIDAATLLPQLASLGNEALALVRERREEKGLRR